VNIFNLGTDEYCRVNDSVSWISERLGVNPARTYSGGERGWVGDSPFIFLDCSRVRALGWRPKLTIREAVVRTLEYLQENRWVLERR
jgi:UDP-glucose 4-epimerase